ncbi:MAG: hypothetical protein ABSF29_16335, partial [Tepidisphaeraceae bacterium]
MTRKFLGVALVATISVFTARARGASFTAGDLVVNTYAYGDSELENGAPSTITLQEFSPSGGSAILADTLPTTNGVGG